jgi:hypothetical protein
MKLSISYKKNIFSVKTNKHVFIQFQITPSKNKKNSMNVKIKKNKQINKLKEKINKLKKEDKLNNSAFTIETFKEHLKTFFNLLKTIRKQVDSSHKSHKPSSKSSSKKGGKNYKKKRTTRRNKKIIGGACDDTCRKIIHMSRIIFACLFGLCLYGLIVGIQTDNTIISYAVLGMLSSLVLIGSFTYAIRAMNNRLSSVSTTDPNEPSSVDIESNQGNQGAINEYSVVLQIVDENNEAPISVFSRVENNNGTEILDENIQAPMSVLYRLEGNIGREIQIVNNASPYDGNNGSVVHVPSIGTIEEDVLYFTLERVIQLASDVIKVLQSIE